MAENLVKPSEFRSKLAIFHAIQDTDISGVSNLSPKQPSSEKHLASGRPKVNDFIRQFSPKADSEPSESPRRLWSSTGDSENCSSNVRVAVTTLGEKSPAINFNKDPTKVSARSNERPNLLTVKPLPTAKDRPVPETPPKPQLPKKSPQSLRLGHTENGQKDFGTLPKSRPIVPSKPEAKYKGQKSVAMMDLRSECTQAQMESVEGTSSQCDPLPSSKSINDKSSITKDLPLNNVSQLYKSPTTIERNPLRPKFQRAEAISAEGTSDQSDAVLSSKELNDESSITKDLPWNKVSHLHKSPTTTGANRFRPKFERAEAISVEETSNQSDSLLSSKESNDKSSIKKDLPLNNVSHLYKSPTTIESNPLSLKFKRAEAISIESSDNDNSVLKGGGNFKLIQSKFNNEPPQRISDSSGEDFRQSPRTSNGSKMFTDEQVVFRDKLERFFGSTLVVNAGQEEDKSARLSQQQFVSDTESNLSFDPSRQSPQSTITPKKGKLRHQMGKLFRSDRDSHFSFSSLELDSLPDNQKKLKSLKASPLIYSRTKNASTNNLLDHKNIQVVTPDLPPNTIPRKHAGLSNGSDESGVVLSQNSEFKSSTLQRKPREKKIPYSGSTLNRKRDNRPATAIQTSTVSPIYNMELIVPQVDQLIHDEEAYVARLDLLQRNFQFIFTLKNLPPSLRGKKYVVLGNIEQIIEFQRDTFLPMLKRNRLQFHNIIEGFLQYIQNDSFYCYILYNMNLSQALDAIKTNTFYLQNVFEDHENIENDLMEPLLRLEQYVGFLKAISTLTYCESYLTRAHSLESLLTDDMEETVNDTCGELAYILEDFMELISSAKNINNIRQCKHYVREKGSCHGHQNNCLYTNLFVVNPREQGRLKKYYDFNIENANDGAVYTGHVYCFEKSIIIADAEGIYLDCLPLDETEITAITNEYFTLYYYTSDVSRKVHFHAPVDIRNDWILQIRSLRHKIQYEKTIKVKRPRKPALTYTPSMCMILSDVRTEPKPVDIIAETVYKNNMKRFSVALPIASNDGKISIRRGLSNVSQILDDRDNSVDFEVNELIETEERYVEKLLNGLKNYESIFQMHNLNKDLRGKKYVLLRNMDQIAEFNRDQVLPMLRKHRFNLAGLVKSFLDFIDTNAFYCYVLYAMYSQDSEDLYERHKLFFQAAQETFMDRLGVVSFLLQPIQRSTRYFLLFDSIMKKLYNKDKQANLAVIEELSILLKKLSHLNNTINEAIVIRKFFNTDVFYDAGLSVDNNINDGQFHKSSVFAYVQNFFSEYSSSNSSSTKLLEFISKKKTYCRLFLFTRCLYIFGLESKSRDTVLKCYRYDRRQVTTMTDANGLHLLFKNEQFTITLLDTTGAINIWLELFRRYWLDDEEENVKSLSPIEIFNKQFSTELSQAGNRRDGELSSSKKPKSQFYIQ